MEQMVFQDLIKDLGFGGVMGFIMGFTVKRIAKFFMLVIGLYVLSLMWLSDLGVVTVEWQKLLEFLKGILSASDDMVERLIRTLSFGGSFAVGFAIGMKI